MALSLARSSPHPAAALPAPRISHFATLLHSPRRPYPGLRLRLRLPAIAVAASSPPEAQAAESTEAAAEGAAEQGVTRRKVFVGNMPWTFSAAEIQKLFSECGVVKDVEVRDVLVTSRLAFSGIWPGFLNFVPLRATEKQVFVIVWPRLS
jgi:hypothetical protein